MSLPTTLSRPLAPARREDASHLLLDDHGVDELEDGVLILGAEAFELVETVQWPGTAQRHLLGGVAGERVVGSGVEGAGELEEGLEAMADAAEAALLAGNDDEKSASEKYADSYAKEARKKDKELKP